MVNQYYLDLAAQGLRMPIGADLVLHEEPDPEAVRLHPEALGRVVERAARIYRTPLAFPLMDLRLEKADLLEFCGTPEPERDAFHFTSPPASELIDAVWSSAGRPFSARTQATHGAIRHIACHTDLVAIGMAIGPFSLMTKLVSDPITPLAMAGSGVSAEQDEGVRLVECCLQLALATVLRSVKAQVEAGAKALVICEPAANTVYLSPRQLRHDWAVFERFVLGPNRKVRALLEHFGVDLIFHNCGELLPEMVHQFAVELRPVVLSLGGSRKLWEDAAVVPKNVVLFGNLPTKLFYSDAAMPLEEVRRLTIDLLNRMAGCGHPHILGSECDVLFVPEAADTLRRKVEAMLNWQR